MKVNVTSEHIKAGRRRKMSSCPIALAIKGKDTSKHVEVYGTGGVYVAGASYFPTNAEKFLTFMDNFDKGKSVTPVSFTLRREVS